MEKYGAPTMHNFTKYFNLVKSQLVCNASEEYKLAYITYDYTNQQVEEQAEYFKKCMLNGLSPYKALLFFHDYLKQEYSL